MPVRNEGDRLHSTIRSILETRSDEIPLEVIIVNDASHDDAVDRVMAVALGLGAPGVVFRILNFRERIGVPRARNAGASVATGDILFVTDAHVLLQRGWDRLALKHVRPDRILAATITDTGSGFHGYGCRLVVPFMGTHWVRRNPGIAPVQIAACPGTVISTRLFRQLGGYDSGMLVYSAAEPEFSVRAWLSGAEVVAVPELQVEHHFKSTEERDTFLDGLRPLMIHNNVRFGLLYLSQSEALQMIRHFAMKFPAHVQEAYRLVAESDVWQRRTTLKRRLKYDFKWFVDRFGLTDSVGRPIPA